MTCHFREGGFCRPTGDGPVPPTATSLTTTRPYLPVLPTVATDAPPPGRHRPRCCPRCPGRPPGRWRRRSSRHSNRSVPAAPLRARTLCRERDAATYRDGVPPGGFP